MNPALLVVLSYLLGAIPTSYWVGRWGYGVDLRERGSGNLGATNVYRVLGWKAALPVVLADVAKGFIPAWLFPRLEAAPWAWALGYGSAAVLGHVYSVWVRFRGGKGVATSAGVLAGLAPAAMLVGFAVWLVTVLTTRMVALGSVLAALSIPAAVWLFARQSGAPLFGFTLAIAVLVIWAHRTNLARIARGEEHRFGRGRPRHAAPPAERER